MKQAAKEEMNAALNSVITEMQHVGLQELRKAAAQKNVRVTEELLRSFKAQMVTEAGAAQRSLMLSFRLYGRWKDMKRVDVAGFKRTSNRGKTYGRSNAEEGLEKAPDVVRGMYAWVKSRGLAEFSYLPGYTGGKSRRMPTTSMMMYRLAWTLAIGRMRKGRIHNKTSRGWYNKAKGRMTNKGAGLLLDKVSNLTVQVVGENLDGLEIRL